MPKVSVDLRARRIASELAKMKPALKEKLIVIGEFLAKGRYQDLASRYEVGAVVREIRTDEDKYGTYAVERVAFCVGRKRDFLYEAARVAATWTPREFRRVIALQTANRGPLSFSHYVALSHVSDPTRRTELLARARAEDLSVRALRQLALPAPAEAEPVTSNVSEQLDLSVRRANAFLRDSLPARADLPALALGADQRALSAFSETYRAVKAHVDRTLESLGALDGATPREGSPPTMQAAARAPRVPEGLDRISLLWGGTAPPRSVTKKKRAG